MFATVVTYYICMKFFLLYSLVRAQVAYEPLQKHFIFLGALFSAGVAFLSYVFIMSPQNAPDWQLRTRTIKKSTPGFAMAPTAPMQLLSRLMKNITFQKRATLAWSRARPSSALSPIGDAP